LGYFFHTITTFLVYNDWRKKKIASSPPAALKMPQYAAGQLLSVSGRKSGMPANYSTDRSTQMLGSCAEKIIPLCRFAKLD